MARIRKDESTKTPSPGIEFQERNTLPTKSKGSSPDPGKVQEGYIMFADLPPDVKQVVIQHLQSNDFPGAKQVIEEWRFQSRCDHDRIHHYIDFFPED